MEAMVTASRSTLVQLLRVSRLLAGRRVPQLSRHPHREADGEQREQAD